jgi:hypothetical protein
MLPWSSSMREKFSAENIELIVSFIPASVCLCDGLYRHDEKS